MTGLGHERHFPDVRDGSSLPPTPERLRQHSEPTLRVKSRHPLLRQALGPRDVRRSNQSSSWPAEIVGKLNSEINVALADLKARSADHGSTGLPGSPDDFCKPIAQDTEKWGKMIRLAGSKAD